MSNKRNILIGLFVLSALITSAAALPNFGEAVTDVVTTLSEAVWILINSPTDNAKVGGNNSIGLSDLAGGFTNESVEIQSATCTVTNPLATSLCTVTLSSGVSHTFGVSFGASGLNDTTGADGGTANVINITGVAVGGGSTASDEVTVYVDTTAPRQVTNITSVRTTTSITWTWDNPTNSDFKATHYKVRKTSDESVVAGGEGFVNATDNPNNSKTISGLSAATEYRISLKTFDNIP